MGMHTYDTPSGSCPDCGEKMEENRWGEYCPDCAENSTADARYEAERDRESDDD